MSAWNDPPGGFHTVSMPDYLPTEAFLAAVRAALPERLHEVNERAFELGRRLAAERDGSP